ncbi:MAG: M48 family metalloprotease [Alphaproteobacteria bacterium]|nr:M48 family metalloprotease [Alphaproteobacteria bacterium]
MTPWPRTIAILRHSLAATLLVLFAATSAVAADRTGIRDAEIERILRNYSDPLFRAAGLDAKSVNIYIIKDDSLNAFVAGGQNVFIHTGMITSLKSPNELKGVIAHETGHISGGHLVRGMDAMGKAQVPMVIGMLAGVAAIAAGAPDVGLGLLMGSQSIAQREFFSYSRTQEAAADQAGVKLLEATGQSPRGMYAVFDLFADQEALSGAKQDPFVRTHPLSRERASTLRSMVDKSPFKERPDSERDQKEYDMMVAKLRGFIEPPTVVLRRYPASDQSRPARYARAAAYFRAADLERALPQIDSLLAEEPENPFFWELRGQMLVESSRPVEGLPAYRKSVQFAPDEPLLRIGLASALLATEQSASVPEAIKNLKVALRDEPENAMAWYYLADAHARSGDDALAALATAERFFSIRRYPQAVSFAQRALPSLKENGRDWQRANDIISIAQSEQGKQASKR